MHTRSGLAQGGRGSVVACLSLLLGLALTAAPLRAQNSGFPPRPDGGRYATRAEYLNSLTGRVALRNDLEERWTAGTRDQQRIDEALERIRTQPAPRGVDARDWDVFRRRETARLEALAEQNRNNVGQVQSTLQRVYDRLAQDNDFLRSAGSGRLSQELGVLAGVGGAALVPVWRRPTPGNLMGRSAHARQVTQLSTINSQLPGLDTQKITTLTDGAIRASQTNQPSQWQTQINRAGNLEVTNGTRTVDLKVPAEIKGTRGSETVPNARGLEQARAYTELYNARDAVDLQRTRLELDRGRASDTKAVKALDKQITELNGKRTELDRDIRKYENDRAQKGGDVQGLIGSAAKWAAFSVGITVGSEVIGQLARNNWDISRVNWRQAIDPITKADFWGGTAGSFALSMVGSMIPGGTVIKTLGSIAGAAIGWQLGSGNIASTDWVHLGATTIGATLGSLLGSSFGPIGTMLGGIAGHMAANWLLNWLRNRGNNNSAEAYDPLGDQSTRDIQVVDPRQNLTNYLNGLDSGAGPFGTTATASTRPGSGAPATRPAGNQVAGATTPAGQVPSNRIGAGSDPVPITRRQPPTRTSPASAPAPAATPAPSGAPTGDAAQIRAQMQQIRLSMARLPPTSQENIRQMQDLQVRMEQLSGELRRMQSQSTAGDYRSSY